MIIGTLTIAVGTLVFALVRIIEKSKNVVRIHQGIFNLIFFFLIMNF